MLPLVAGQCLLKECNSTRVRPSSLAGLALLGSSSERMIDGAFQHTQCMQVWPDNCFHLIKVILSDKSPVVVVADFFPERKKFSGLLSAARISLIFNQIECSHGYPPTIES